VLLAERIVVTRIGIGLPNQVRGVRPTVTPDWAVRAEWAGFSTLCIVGRCAYPGVMDTVALMAWAGVSVYRGIMVEIPSGWHELIDSGNPIIPEMVAPTTADTIQQAVTSAPGVTAGPIASEGPGNIEGPGNVGKHGGYRRRFTQGNREFSVVLVWVSDAPTPRNRTPSTTSWPPRWSPAGPRPDLGER
jgi:hypothetical protein